jgi:hypothetical protein
MAKRQCGYEYLAAMNQMIDLLRLRFNHLLIFFLRRVISMIAFFRQGIKFFYRNERKPAPQGKVY